MRGSLSTIVMRAPGSRRRNSRATQSPTMPAPMTRKSGASAPGIDVDVGAGAELRRPLLDLRLQARRADRGAYFLAHLAERRHGEAPLAALLRPRRAVVLVDLLVRDEHQRREALLDVRLHLQLALRQRTHLVQCQLRADERRRELRLRGEALADLHDAGLDPVGRDVLRAEALH